MVGLAEGFSEEVGLFLVVDGLAPRGGARALHPADLAEGPSAGEAVRRASLDERPGPHVERLLLHPPDLACVRVAVEDLVELSAWERVELLDAHHRDRTVVLLPRLHQRVRDLP